VPAWRPESDNVFGAAAAVIRVLPSVPQGRGAAPIRVHGTGVTNNRSGYTTTNWGNAALPDRIHHGTGQRAAGPHSVIACNITDGEA